MTLTESLEGGWAYYFAFFSQWYWNAGLAVNSP